MLCSGPASQGWGRGSMFQNQQSTWLFQGTLRSAETIPALDVGRALTTSRNDQSSSWCIQVSPTPPLPLLDPHVCQSPEVGPETSLALSCAALPGAPQASHFPATIPEAPLLPCCFCSPISPNRDFFPW